MQFNILENLTQQLFKINVQSTYIILRHVLRYGLLLYSTEFLNTLKCQKKIDEVLVIFVLPHNKLGS